MFLGHIVWENTFGDFLAPEIIELIFEIFLGLLCPGGAVHLFGDGDVEI